MKITAQYDADYDESTPKCCEIIHIADRTISDYMVIGEMFVIML